MASIVVYEAAELTAAELSSLGATAIVSHPLETLYVATGAAVEYVANSFIAKGVLAGAIGYGSYKGATAIHHRDQQFHLMDHIPQEIQQALAAHTPKTAPPDTPPAKRQELEKPIPVTIGRRSYVRTSTPYLSNIPIWQSRAEFSRSTSRRGSGRGRRTRRSQRSRDV